MQPCHFAIACESPVSQTSTSVSPGLQDKITALARRNKGFVLVRNAHIEGTLCFDEERIFLREHQLHDDDVKDLLDALVQGKFTQVKTIEMSANNLSDVSLERIAQALKTNSTVTLVDLVSSLPIFLLLLQSSFARSLQYVTRAVCTELQPRHY
jgi:hypothetical protein